MIFPLLLATAAWIAPLTLVFSGVAAFSAIFSVIYSARAARRKSERELLASKLENLFASLKKEWTEVVQAAVLVQQTIQQRLSPEQVYSVCEETIRPIWNEINDSEILVRLYFPQLIKEFDEFRSMRVAIAKDFRSIPTTSSLDAVNFALFQHIITIGHAYDKMGHAIIDVASKICPQR